MKISVHPLILNFKRPAGTSRGILNVKHSWVVTIELNGLDGVGEISIIEGLSKEYTDIESFEGKIVEFCDQLEKGWGKNQRLDQLMTDLTTNLELLAYPSILFGLESALLDLTNGGNKIYFDNDFASGNKKIPINGLVWMGDKRFMEEQIEEKLNQGYTTIKMKIGAIDIESELNILASIRSAYSPEQITLRVDANGAFNFMSAKEILKQLANLEIHSIEQPIPAGNIEQMAELCALTPIPIALDEELIGIIDKAEKLQLLEEIRPQFIILKPSLHGGVSGTREWISLAEKLNIGWWMTSALESNIGLNVICQLAAEYDNPLPQGLGTGSLYTNNTPTDLIVEKGFIYTKKGAIAPLY